MEMVSPREAKAKRWSAHMVSLLWTKSSSACLTASIRFTAGRASRGTAAGSAAVAPVTAPGDPEAEGEGEAGAAFISERASASTSTQKSMSSRGRRLAVSENIGEGGAPPWRGVWSMIVGQRGGGGSRVVVGVGSREALEMGVGVAWFVAVAREMLHYFLLASRVSARNQDKSRESTLLTEFWKTG